MALVFTNFFRSSISQHLLGQKLWRNISSSSKNVQQKLNISDPKMEETEQTNDKVSVLDTVHQDLHEVASGESDKTLFPDLVHPVRNKVSFWETERGLQLKDTALTGVGRALRLFITEERYDNWWESSLEFANKTEADFNKFDDIVFTNHGAEWAMCLLVLRLGGAFKLVTDNRWIDDAHNIRTPNKKDCTVEALDFRKSCLNYEGMKYFERIGYVRYLNLGDSKLFNNDCMTRLHPLADVLEYLDVSGTAITVESLSYLRLFKHLKWVNLSRLSNMPQVECMLPFIKEILPSDCVVVTNDELPPESYGSEIPYRCLKDPSKDLILVEDPGIGNVALFRQRYGDKALQVNDVTPIHQLWQTPIMAKPRQIRVMLNDLDGKYKVQTLIEYINKAEKYAPLL